MPCRAVPCRAVPCRCRAVPFRGVTQSAARTPVPIVVTCRAVLIQGPIRRIDCLSLRWDPGCSMGSASRKQRSPVPDMREESQRLLTFHLDERSFLFCFFHPPEAWARAGFFYRYEEPPGEIECAFCGLRLFPSSYDTPPLEDHRHFRPQCPFVLEQDNATAGIPGDGGRSDPTEAACTSTPPAGDTNEESQQRLVQERDNATAGIPGDGERSDPTEASRTLTPPAGDTNEESQQRLVREQGNATAGTPGDGGRSDPTEAARTSTPPADDTKEESQQRLVREQGNATAGTPGGHSDPTEDDGFPPLVPDMREEAQRLLTFRGWPLSSPSPETLARAGFFFLRRRDEVECAFCGTQVYDWQTDNEPSHRRWHPQCPLQREQDNAAAGNPGAVGSSDPTEAARPSALPSADIREESQRRSDRGSSPVHHSVNQELISRFASAATLSPMAADNGGPCDERLCIICMDEEACMLFMPCCHLATCVQCAPELQVCCVCRARITGLVRAYMP